MSIFIMSDIICIFVDKICSVQGLERHLPEQAYLDYIMVGSINYHRYLVLLCALTFCLLLFLYGTDCQFLQSYSPLYSFRKLTSAHKNKLKNKAKLINRTYLI